ncbi:MAG: hypothetical protein ABIC57_02385 [bacterium]
MKPLLLTLKFIFENTPNIGFWIGAIHFFHEWYLQQGIFIKILIWVISIISITKVISTLIKNFKILQSEILKSNAEIGYKDVKNTKKTDPTKLMIMNIPSSQNLKRTYKYATKYAESWASDGELMKIVYYLDLSHNKIRKSAQIFIKSSIRNELLTTYIPNPSDSIEESEQGITSNETKIPKIYSFQNWKEAVKISIENSTSDINKSDSLKIQLSPVSDSMHITFWFEKNNRKWKKRFKLSKNRLEINNKTITDFN